jgi:hypothetical protein
MSALGEEFGRIFLPVTGRRHADESAAKDILSKHVKAISRAILGADRVREIVPLSASGVDS